MAKRLSLKSLWKKADQIDYEKLDPKIKVLVETAFRLGVNHAEIEACKKCRDITVSKLVTVNANLWEALNNIDNQHPVSGISLSYQEAGTVIKALNRGGKNTHLAGILKYRVLQEAERANLPDILKILKTGWPERFKTAASKPLRRKRKK